jgi:hypothetical protein
LCLQEQWMMSHSTHSSLMLISLLQKSQNCNGTRETTIHSVWVDQTVTLEFATVWRRTFSSISLTSKGSLRENLTHPKKLLPGLVMHGQQRLKIWLLQYLTKDILLFLEPKLRSASCGTEYNLKNALMQNQLVLSQWKHVN